MRILILTNKVPIPPIDGGAVATITMAKGLASGGDQVRILAMNTPKHFVDPDSIPEFPAEMLNIACIKVKKPITICSIARNLLFSRLPFTLVRFQSKEFAHAIESELEKDYDVIQLEGLYLTWYIPLIRKFSQASIILRAHNIEHEIWERVAKQSNKWHWRWYASILSRRIREYKLSVISEFDGLVPITGRDNLRFKALGCQKPSIVIPVGVTPGPVPVFGIPPTGPDFFHLGALDWAPNQDGLMWFFDRVWPRIIQKCPKAQFHLGGRNCPAWLEKRWKKVRNLHYYGELESATDFFSQHLIMVVPLRSGSGIRVKILEGMAMGKAIVTTSIGAEGIYSDPDQPLVIADSEDSFSEACCLMLNNPEETVNLGKRARHFVIEHFNNLIFMDQYRAFLKSFKSPK